MFDNPLFAAESFRYLQITGEEIDYNVHTALGSPNYLVRVLIEIEPTGLVYNFNTGPLAANSLVRVINSGYILGTGGDGGDGALEIYEVEEDITLVTPPADGGVGSNAITTQCNLQILTDEGYIWGGGGGGGGDSILSGTVTVKRGQGGSGGVSGGVGGVGTPNGQSATSGINAVPGTLQAAGGNWGEAGSPGQSGGPYGFGAGGAGGQAIKLNGFSLFIIGKSETVLRSENRILGVID